MKKEHLEVLLENIDGKFDLVLEGHAVLNKKIDNVQASLDEHKQQNKEEHQLLLQMISDVNEKVGNLDQKNEAAHATLNKKLDAREKETSDLKRRVTRLEAVRT